MEKANNANTSEYIKAIIGAVIFLTVGILLTSKSLNLSDNIAILILQCFSLGLVVMAVSLMGYYFDKPSNEDELPEKLLLFTFVLIPTALVFFVSESYQELFFFISFFISICIMLIHRLTFKRAKENYILTILTSAWVLLSVIVLIKHYEILPVKFFNKLSFLHLETIQTIRIILLIGITIHIIIISFVEAIKPENKILEAQPILTVPVPTEIDSYHSLLRPFLWLAYLASLFLNIGIFLVNLTFAGLRIILDSVLRFGWQVILSIVKISFGWRSITFFLLLYLVTFSIPFIISVNSTFLLSYVRGVNLDFQMLLSQIGILMLAVFTFRLLVTFQFCDVKGSELFDLSNIIPPLKSKTYIDNFIPLVYCIVFYSFFISFTSAILILLANFCNSFLDIQGYKSIGNFTEYCSYIIIGAILIVVLLKFLNLEIN
ncbi:MAG: hypothetical protein IPI90_11180 [Saprospiraceae bacterium]|nr:hypothetical protein [Candidatus Vicinibacter affinis]